MKKLDLRGSVGTWVSIPSAHVMEVLASSSISFLVIDLEHSDIELPMVTQMIRAAELFDKPTLVRITGRHIDQVRRVLDLGAQGLVIPNVVHLSDVEQVLKATFYPPKGGRGVALTRASTYGEGFEEYYRNANDRLTVIFQVESVLAIQNLDGLVDPEYVDGIMVGPYDLSASLGIPGQFTDPRYIDAVDQIGQKCREKNIPLGYHQVAVDQDAYSQALDLFDFTIFSVDFQLLKHSLELGLRTAADHAKKA